MNSILFRLFLKFIRREDIEKCCSRKHLVICWKFPSQYLQKQKFMFPISLSRLYFLFLNGYLRLQEQ